MKKKGSSRSISVPKGAEWYLCVQTCGWSKWDKNVTKRKEDNENVGKINNTKEFKKETDKINKQQKIEQTKWKMDREKIRKKNKSTAFKDTKKTRMK